MLDGSLRVGGVEMMRDDVLIAEKNAEIGAFEPGPEGVHLLEVVRTEDARACGARVLGEGKRSLVGNALQGHHEGRSSMCVWI